MKNYSILFYTGGGQSSRPWVKSGGGGQCQFFWAFRPRFGLRIRGEGQSAILPHPPPRPLPLIGHCIWLDCRRGLCCKCGLPNCLWYDSVFNQSNFDCKLLLISGIQIKPPRSHHCSICKRWIYCIISITSFNFFTNSWILMLRAFIVTYSV